MKLGVDFKTQRRLIMLKKDLIPQPAFMEPIRSKSNWKAVCIQIGDGTADELISRINEEVSLNVKEGHRHEFTFGVDDGVVDIQLETWIDELDEHLLNRRAALFGEYEAESKVIILKNLEIEAHNAEVDEFYAWRESNKLKL